MEVLVNLLHEDSNAWFYVRKQIVQGFFFLMIVYSYVNIKPILLKHMIFS